MGSRQDLLEVRSFQTEVGCGCWRTRTSPSGYCRLEPLQFALALPARLARWAHVHPRRLAGGTVVLLGGFAVTAFGIAPMAPDAAALPKRVVTEDYRVADLDTQLDALAAQHLTLARSDTTRSNDSAAKGAAL